MPQALHRELHIRAAQIRVRHSGVELHRPVRIRTSHCPKPANVADVQLLRLPRQEALRDLLRKPFRIGRRAECLLRQDARSLMVPVPVTGRSRKPCHQHVRTKRSNHPHHVGERYVVSAPLRESLVGTFRKPKIGHAREALLHSVIFVRCQQFQGSQHAQHIRQIAADLVLPTLAAVQGHQQHARSAPARLQREHSAIFIIGMRDRLHQPRRRAQPPQHQPQAEDSSILRKFRRSALVGKLRKIRGQGLLTWIRSRRSRPRRAFRSRLWRSHQ